MNRKRIALAALLLAHPFIAAAQVTGRPAADGCISVAGPSSRVTAEGRLSLQLFPGPANYDSIAAGDGDERSFILELPRPACIDDGGEFADPSEAFVTVHVSATEEALLAVLRASIGRRVTVSGEGFGSHTGHHHAPLVVLADNVAVH